MPQERFRDDESTGLALDDEEQERAVSRADAWLTRLQPLFRDDGPLDLADVEASLGLVRELREVAPDIQHGVRSDAARRVGLSEGLVRLDQLERRLRERLTELDPSNPDALTDSPVRAARVAEAVSQREGEARLAELASTPLVETLCRPDPKAAKGPLSFALFWNGFTLVHASILLTAFFHAFGPVALLGMFFYAIFFTVGAVVAKSAIDLLATQNLRYGDDVVRLTSTLGPFTWTKRIVTGENSRFAAVKSRLSAPGKFNREIAVKDMLGKEHRFGGVLPASRQDALIKRLNERCEARKLLGGTNP